jgi:arginine decarboxylase
MYLIPKEFFVTSGKATSGVSDLNAFDLALLHAGIEEQNLVAVSSIIPPEAEEVPCCRLPMGAVTHCVLAQMRGRDGDRISAGIGYAYRKDGYGGYVAESHIFGGEEAVRNDLRRKIAEMQKIRGVELSEPTIVTETLEVPENGYGCCLASLVFTAYRE